MSMKATLILACLLGAPLGFCGCTGPVGVPAHVSGEPVANAMPDATTLRSWAEALGAEELAKLAAAELVYRNKNFEFYMDGGDGVIQRAYSKYFRQFRSYTVEDVERTNSVLRPIKYTIRYDFDLLGTSPILGNPTGTEFLERMRADYYFQKDLSDSIVRVYESGPDYRPVNPFSPYLERPNYWHYRTNASLFGQEVWLREIPDGVG